MKRVKVQAGLLVGATLLVLLALMPLLPNAQSPNVATLTVRIPTATKRMAGLCPIYRDPFLLAVGVAHHQPLGNHW